MKNLQQAIAIGTDLPRTAECPHQNGTPFGGGMNASETRSPTPAKTDNL
ncbi:MAG: hypothetical protein ACRC2R_17980 [Xenococcaceae cyanobacterium]